MPWKAGSPSRRFAVVSRRFFAAAFDGAFLAEHQKDIPGNQPNIAHLMAQHAGAPLQADNQTIRRMGKTGLVDAACGNARAGGNDHFGQHEILIRIGIAGHLAH